MTEKAIGWCHNKAHFTRQYRSTLIKYRHYYTISPSKVLYIIPGIFSDLIWSAYLSFVCGRGATTKGVCLTIRHAVLISVAGIPCILY